MEICIIIHPCNMSLNFSHIKALIKQLRDFGTVIFLDSQKSDHPASSKSYLAAKPRAEIMAFGNHIRQRGIDARTWKQNPWEALKNFQSSQKNWLFGYLGYDLKNYGEVLYSRNQKKYEAPEYHFMVPELLLQIDENGQVEVILGDLFDVPEPEEKGNFSIFAKGDLDKKTYIERIKKIQQNIVEGNYYELNYSYPLEFECKGDPLNLYQAMRESGPVPFGAYLHSNNLTVCCSSPERFLQKTGSRVRSQPIKGTVENKEHHTEGYWRELLLSNKNKAENLMIVDLVRNDLNRFARPGTVQVSHLFEVQSFDTVHQLVSTVECQVDDGTHPVEIIRNCFPMGSMTGAPKIAAMQAIEEIEYYNRGIYSGAIGYVSPIGNFDFNVVIRSAIIQGQKLVYPVGGAITADSEANDEWHETQIKAQALFRAV